MFAATILTFDANQRQRRLGQGEKMNSAVIPARQAEPDVRANWAGVFAMALGAFVLVASEFMPVSLLTPIATDLRISEGRRDRRLPYPAPLPC
jgi:predicted phage tail protein